MKPEQLLKISALSGKILLESGAEIHRTEDTICRICEAYGVEEASAFVIPTGMFLSFTADGESYSRIMRIRGSSLNLERINRVNDISRRCVRQPMPFEEIMAELLQIQQTRNYRPLYVTLAGGFIAMFFTPFFGGSLPDALAAFPIGMLCLGYYRENHLRKPRKRFDRQYIVFDEKYKHLTDEEYRAMYAEQAATFQPDNPYGADNFAQAFYARKTGAVFSKEMARSTRVAMKQWDGRLLNPKVPQK